MASLGSQLGRSLEAPPVPSSKSDLVDYAGGRRELVELLTGQDGPPRRTSYAAGARGDSRYANDRREWRNAQRRVERWTTAAGERRGATPAKLTPAQKRAIRRDANERHRAELKRRGLRARLTATVRVSKDRRTRTMPARGTPGVLLDGETVAEILDEIAEEGRAAAADDFLGAFFDAYGIGEEVEVDEEEETTLKVWVNGEREPM